MVESIDWPHGDHVERTAAATAITTASTIRRSMAASETWSVGLLHPAGLRADPGQVDEVAAVGSLREQVEVVHESVLRVEVAARFAPAGRREPRRDPAVAG